MDQGALYTIHARSLYLSSMQETHFQHWVSCTRRLGRQKTEHHHDLLRSPSLQVVRLSCMERQIVTTRMTRTLMRGGEQREAFSNPRCWKWKIFPFSENFFEKNCKVGYLYVQTHFLVPRFQKRSAACGCPRNTQHTYSRICSHTRPHALIIRHMPRGGTKYCIIHHPPTLSPLYVYAYVYAYVCISV